MNILELHKILHSKVQPGPELNNQVKLNVDTDFKKVQTPINQNIGINMQSLNKIPAQDTFSDKFNKIVNKIPWKDLMLWAAIGGCFYLLWKIPTKKIIHEENDDFQEKSILRAPIL